jgi:hypothetical protein
MTTWGTVLPAVPGPYLPLHKYLDGRFADTIKLTFSEIEDLLGFILPDVAARELEWWTNEPVEGTAPHSRSWINAHRTATANLRARTVAFERRPA